MHIISKPLHSSGLQLPFEEAYSGRSPIQSSQRQQNVFNFLWFPQFNCDVDHVHSPFYFLKNRNWKVVGQDHWRDGKLHILKAISLKVRVYDFAIFCAEGRWNWREKILSIVAPMTKRPILCATLLIIHNRTTVVCRCGEADKWPVRSPVAGRRTKFAVTVHCDREF